MNHLEFQANRERILATRTEIVDCGETNLYRSLSDLIPPRAEHAGGIVHRCHLAEDWANRFGLADFARQALCSSGVRHALRILFRHYAKSEAILWLPEDNYPVYGELARAAGMMPRTFTTLPAPCWPAEIIDEPSGRPELLLTTNPVKPLGRWLSNEDETFLSWWLSRSPRRRLVLDAVYTWSTTFHATTLRLFDSGRAILLHSLTKGWLEPRLFGVALVPEVDLPALAPEFRKEPPPQANLARATRLLRDHADTPSRVASSLHRAAERLAAVVPEIGRDAAPSYFFVVRLNHSELLEGRRILGIPASVFGSARDDLTILSSLAFLR